MKRRQGLAEDLKKIIFSADSNENENEKKKQAYFILKRMQDYYIMYDLDNNTNHQEIFKVLYLTNKYSSDIAIAQRMFITVETLRNYISKYNRLIGRLIEMLNFKL